MKARLGTNIAVLTFACCAWIVAGAASANAAVPVSAITNCDTAVAAMNAGLTTLSRSRFALKEAKATHRAVAIKRAKTRVAAAEAQRDLVREKIKTLCGAGGVNALAGGCSSAIGTLGDSIDQLAASRRQLSAVKTSDKNAKQQRGKLQSQIRKLERLVAARTEEMREACTPPVAVSAATGPAAGPIPIVSPPDTTPPTVTIAVNTPTNDMTPHVDLSASEAGVTFACSLDGTAFAASPAAFDLPLLSENSHTLACKGTDAANNVGAVTSKTIVIDTTAPGMPSMGGPLTGAAGASLNYLVILSTGDSAHCNVDLGAYSLTSAGSFFVTLGLGTHYVHCYMTDAAGNDSVIRTYGPVLIA